MNRRECLAALATCLTAAGTPAEIEAIDKEPEPLLLMIKPHRPISRQGAISLREALEKAFKGKPHPPIIVVPQQLEIEIEAIIDPRAK